MQISVEVSGPESAAYSKVAEEEPVHQNSPTGGDFYEEINAPVPMLSPSIQLAEAPCSSKHRQQPQKRMSEYEEKMYELNKLKVEQAMRHAEEIHQERMRILKSGKYI